MLGNHPRELRSGTGVTRLLDMEDNTAKRFPVWIKFVVPLGLAALVGGFGFYYHWLYPYGHRVGCLPKTPLGALSVLCP